MRIIKKGQLPDPYQYVGHCTHCECDFEATNAEVTVGVQYNQTVYTSTCPTRGCERPVTMQERGK